MNTNIPYVYTVLQQDKNNICVVRTAALAGLPLYLKEDSSEVKASQNLQGICEMWLTLGLITHINFNRLSAPKSETEIQTLQNNWECASFTLLVGTQF